MAGITLPRFKRIRYKQCKLEDLLAYLPEHIIAPEFLDDFREKPTSQHGNNNATTIEETIHLFSSLTHIYILLSSQQSPITHHTMRRTLNKFPSSSSSLMRKADYYP